MKVAELHRYPVKGLSPEPVRRFELSKGAYVPGDRLYAIEHGPSGFDPDAPRWQPKTRYLTLMRQGGLARLRTRYDDESTTLSVADDGRSVEADLSSPAGRERLERFIAEALPDEIRAPLKLLPAADGFRFTDSRRGYVSLINKASVAALEGWIGWPVDPLRFRGNVLLDGLPAWAEFDLVGQTLAGPSGLELRVTDRIVRCPATDVDPATGARDLDIPGTLRRHLGHADCGIYALVARSGSLAAGDTLVRAAPAEPTLPFTA